MTEPRVVQGEVLMHSIDSTAIASAGYHHEEHLLFIVFHHHRYSATVFFDVPVEVFQDFMKAESKGKYFNTYIKGLYESDTTNIQPKPQS